MNKSSTPKPLIVIVGQTASGKTSLAIEVALRCNGEIICADSMTIYRNMNIGTAKPSTADQERVKHHLLDIVDPNEKFTVHDFKVRAQKTIEDIIDRGKVPILVGGSGLYVDAVLYDYQFRPSVPLSIREKYEKYSVEELQAELIERGITMPENSANKRYLIRSAEVGSLAPTERKMRPSTYIFGINTDPSEQKVRSKLRLEEMLAQGLIDEVRALGELYGWDIAPMQAPSYRAFRGFVMNEYEMGEAKEKCLQYEAQIAKKQRTWFKRNKSIQWYSDPSKIVEISTTILNT
jgi:tRNA dimethylallyltransferase